MKKQAFMVLLSMIVSVSAQAQLPVIVLASNEHDLNSVIAENANCPVRRVALAADITLSQYLKIGEGCNVTLDLNGHTLKRNLTATNRDGHVIEIYSKGTLTIVDNAGGGTISGGRANNGGGICNYGKLYFQGGTITDCKAAQQGGGIKNNSGATVTMSGGTVVGCWGEDCGGIFNAKGGTLNISGGTISGNTSHAGGGGVVNYGTATISGGTIHGNHATTRGGGIWSNGTMTISDARIIENHSEREGGGIWNDGTLNMSGTVTVQDNTMFDGLTGNVYLKSGRVINVTGSLGNSRIGIGFENSISGTATSGYASHNSAPPVHFTNDFAPVTLLKHECGEACLLKVPDVIHYIERAWDDVNKKVVAAIKMVPVSECTFLDSTVTKKDFHTSSSGKPYLVVRGRIALGNITVDDNCSLILCDGASLSGNDYCAVIDIQKGKRLDIYGQINGSGQLKDGAIWVTEDRALNIHGGNIKVRGARCEGGWSAGIGGTEFASRSRCGVVTIYGGTIDATGKDQCAGIGGARRGDGGTITIYGGTITAHGGSSIISNSGAGIGGGDTGSGGNINIHGGEVHAYGGNDAAGIGSGEEGCFGNCNGGNITITGGRVYAYGNDCAAGIGAGQDAGMGHITITGGYVEAHGGGGEGWANAIASNDDDYVVGNSITLGDNMMVASERVFTFPERIYAVRSRRDVVIYPCPDSTATSAQTFHFKSDSDDSVTAVDGIEAREAEDSVVGYYTLDGIQVDQPVKGIYVVKYASGKTRKVNIR